VRLINVAFPLMATAGQLMPSRCDWLALMPVISAFGRMNLFWMVRIALFTLVEKQGTKRLPTLIAGAIPLV